MAFFSYGESRNKLMILYFLREMEHAVTQSQLYFVFAKQGWMDYFDFQTAFLVLEEDAFIAAIPCAYGQGYHITPHGENTLALFEEEIPQSIREELRQYAQQNKELLKNETQFAAYQTRMPDDSYLAVMRLMDKTTHIVDISLRLPNQELAQAACDAWPEAAESIYQELLKKLLP